MKESTPLIIAGAAAAVKLTTQVICGSCLRRLRDDWDWAKAASYLAPASLSDPGRYPAAASLGVGRAVGHGIGGTRHDDGILVLFNSADRATRLEECGSRCRGRHPRPQAA
jgi:hypothetical protein